MQLQMKSTWCWNAWRMGQKIRGAFPLLLYKWIALLHLKECWNYKSSLLYSDSLEWEKASKIIDKNDCCFLPPLHQKIICCRRRPGEPEALSTACLGFAYGSWLKVLFLFYSFTCLGGRGNSINWYKAFDISLSYWKSLKVPLIYIAASFGRACRTIILHSSNMELIEC